MENGSYSLLAPFRRYLRPRMKSIVCLAHVHIGDVGVNLGRRDVAVAEQCLHRTRVCATLHQVSPKTVTQRVRRNVWDLSFGGVRFDDAPGELSA